MPECDYCEESFDGEDAYLAHLEDAHQGELGPIDSRRIGGDEGDGGLPTGQLAVAGVAVGVVALLGGVLLLSVGGSGSEIGPAGSAHYHGTIQMSVLGDRVDFTQEQYQLRDDRFHFEGDGRWHAHATGVTLDYGMETLGIGVTGSSVRFQGTNYTEADGYEISVTVNDEAVSTDYVLQDGDTVQIVVAER
ncbi:hypothetical protein [Haloarcula montana]|uniref:hypothetical protein n=1 Tax=Haloarcula montana TaxID=3111776 RepID=UPI002D767C48|nr:hypothetical protein [Haloarcula sp. GH36]